VQSSVVGLQSPAPEEWQGRVNLLTTDD